MADYLTKSLLVPLALAAASFPAARAQDTVHVVIVASTDIHGRVYHWNYLEEQEAPWGVTRAATAIDSLRREYRGRVVVVDAGDLIQGNPFATYHTREQQTDPNPAVDALNAAGYDVATPGNHDMDFGVDPFLRAMSGAAFPIVSANVYRMPRDTFQFIPYTVLERAGIRIGVTGFTTPGVMVWNRQKVTGRLTVRPIAQTARRLFADPSWAGADLRVAIAHSGIASSASYDTTGIGAENEAGVLALLNNGPHLVVVGHSHGRFTDSVINGVHFIQPQAWGRSLAVAHVWLVGEQRTGNGEGKSARYRILRIEGEEIELAEVPPRPTVSRRLERAHQAVRLWVSAPLAAIDDTWSGQYARAGDTPLIDFVNEVQRRITGADLSSTAAFNLRARFGPGDVRMRDVAALYPYENTLRAVRIDGRTLAEYLERSAAYFNQLGSSTGLVVDSIPGYNFDIVSGVDYSIDLTRPVGSRIRQLSRNGRLVQPGDTFTMAINSYRQEGGGGFRMLSGLPVVYDREEDIRDLLTRWVRDADTLRTSEYFTQSWQIVPADAASALRQSYGPPEVVTTVAARPDPGLRVFAPLDTVDARAAPSGPPPRPVARLAYPAERRGTDHPLGRLVADGLRNGARTHFALLLNSSVVGDLPSGHVTRRDVEAVLVRSDSLFRVSLTGERLSAVLEHVVAGDQPVAHVAGVEVWYDPSRDPGERIRSLRLPDGQRVEPDRTYLLAVSGSLAEGAEGFAKIGALEREASGITTSQALLDYLGRLPQPVEAPRNPRIHTSR